VDRDVFVREVGLRDGLQAVDSFFSTAAKKAWITAEAAAGVHEIQACSFVPKSVFEQFVDAGEIVAHAISQPGLVVSVFTPNVKGAERAIAAGAHRLGHVTSASESHNQNNLRRSVDDSINDFERIVAMRNEQSDANLTSISGCVATAFGCTIEGAVDPDVVIRLATRYVELGADELVLADTVGYGNPAQVKALFLRARSEVGDIPLAAHFHDTRGLGLANVCGAMDAGVRAFDASLGGLGGCPFAPGATGNIVTEDLVFMLEAMGMRTGIDLDALVAVREIVARQLPDEPLHGAIATAHVPKGFAATTATSLSHD
jgi:hydroxymethylglutaryl-CoA lyase